MYTQKVHYRKQDRGISTRPSSATASTTATATATTITACGTTDQLTAISRTPHTRKYLQKTMPAIIEMNPNKHATTGGRGRYSQREHVDTCVYTIICTHPAPRNGAPGAAKQSPATIVHRHVWIGREKKNGESVIIVIIIIIMRREKKKKQYAGT